MEYIIQIPLSAFFFFLKKKCKTLYLSQFLTSLLQVILNCAHQMPNYSLTCFPVVSVANSEIADE